MTVWLRQLSISRLLTIIRKMGAGFAIVVIITAIVFPHTSFAAPNDGKTISFSARLRSSSGNIVSDGSYNIHFNLYSQNEGGTPIWSETYYDKNGAAAGEDARVSISNGYIHARLGSETPFGSIDWSSDLWLTMTVGGTTQTASAASTEWSGWDGEMNPRIQLSAVPYAMNSGTVGGKSADQLVQLGQGKQTDNSTGTSSIFIDKTGESGDLMELQTAGINVFTLDRSGNIILGSNSNKSISIADSTDGSGQNLTIAAGNSTYELGDGGDLIIRGGSSSGTDTSGGNVEIDAGSGGETGSNGSIAIGTVNASSIAIGNPDSSTIISGNLQSGNLDTTEGETTLSIGQDNATSINLGQDTAIADGKSLTVGGDTTIKSALSNSTEAFTVEDNEGNIQLAVDTLNNRVKIGSNDTITSLLILDKKHTEGDPSGGEDGAMYYNSIANKFRCHQNGEWTDCITPLPVSKTITQDVLVDDTETDIEEMEFDLSANTRYHYKFMILSDTPTTDTGFGFGVVINPDIASSNHWCVNTNTLLDSATGNTPNWGSYCGTGDVSTTTSGDNSAGNIYTSSMEGYISTGAENIKLTLRAMSEVNGETNIQKGSFGIVQIVQ